MVPSFIPTAVTLLTVLVPCAQRVVQVSAITMDDAPWRPADGTASASRDGEGRGATLPWKHYVPTARTTKEVCLCRYTKSGETDG